MMGSRSPPPLLSSSSFLFFFLLSPPFLAVCLTSLAYSFLCCRARSRSSRTCHCTFSELDCSEITFRWGTVCRNTAALKMFNILFIVDEQHREFPRPHPKILYSLLLLVTSHGRYFLETWFSRSKPCLWKKRINQLPSHFFGSCLFLSSNSSKLHSTRLLFSIFGKANSCFLDRVAVLPERELSKFSPNA